MCFYMYILYINSAWSEITKDVADLTTNWTDSLKNLTWRWEVNTFINMKRYRVCIRTNKFVFV
jgi:hypothetical protein